jgi:parvulin-like peptidyl-prolyl isomerase
MTILLCLSAAFPAAAQTQPADDAVVAALGPVTLTGADVRALIAALGPQGRSQIAADPALLEAAIRTDLVRRLVLAEAERSGWSARPDVTALAERARLAAIIDSFLASRSAPPADYPSEAQIKAVYDANTGRFLAEPQYHLAQIFVPSGQNRDGGSDPGQVAAEAASRDARAPGADFAALARARSAQTDTAANGGDMGWVAENALRPEVRDAVLLLAPGEVSDPVRGAEGWHVLKLIERRPAGLRPLEEVRPAIVEALRRQAAQDRERAYLAQLAGTAQPAIDSAALNVIRETAAPAPTTP